MIYYKNYNYKRHIKTLYKKLKHYRYCSDVSDLQYGYYIRWIP